MEEKFHNFDPSISPKKEGGIPVGELDALMKEFYQELRVLEVERDMAIKNFIEQKTKERIEEVRQSILN